MTVTLTWRHVLAIQVAVALALTAPAALPLPAEAEEHEEEEQWEEEFDVGAPDEVYPTPDEHGICPTSVHGYLAPTQAVWQDDKDNGFRDLPGKQITWDDQAKVGRAELPMVKDKPTVVVGVHRYANNPPGRVGKREHVVLHITTTGSANVETRVRFHTQGVPTQPVLNHIHPLGPLPLAASPGGGCGPERKLTREVPAQYGLRPAPAFRFAGTGPYTILAELETHDGGRSFGAARVQGQVVETVSPALLFIPVVLQVPNRLAPGRVAFLENAARQASADAALHIPDYWPLATLDSRYVRTALPDRELFLSMLSEDHEKWYRRLFPGQKPGWFDRRGMRQAMNQFLGQGSRLGDGRKVMAVLPADEFRRLTSDAAGLALSQHVMLMSEHGARSLINHLITAHELTHTLPWSWSGPEMSALCARPSWHNEQERVATGMRVTLRGDERRELIDNRYSFMSSFDPAEYRDVWSDQCVYWHLTTQLTAPGGAVAPIGGQAVRRQDTGQRLAIQGLVARSGDTTAGELLPAYLTTVPVDPPWAAPDAAYALVLRSADGGELARHPFAADFGDEEDQDPLVHFGYVVPRPIGLARIELEGPGGVMDVLTASAHAPTVTLDEPRAATLTTSTGEVAVRWRGSDRDGDALVYTLLQSLDAGASWVPVAVDIAGQAATVQVAAGDRVRLRLLVSDGVHSDQVEIGFTVEAAAACPSGEVPAAGFTDTAGNTHEAAIDCVAWHGIAHGTTTTTYSPTLPVRRDQMASFLARLVDRAGASLPSGGGAGFTDIAGNTHEAAIRGLAAAGIVQGTTPTTYAPDMVVRRDQMASFLVRVYEYIAAEELTRAPSGFADVGGNTHEVSIDKAAAAGFARGTTPTTYSPAAPVRRDQMASFLTRALDRLAADGRLVAR